jgi:hypothetical protein
MTPGDSDGWRLKGCAAVMVIGSDQASFRHKESRNAAAVSPCGSSQLRMTLPSGRDVTLGEKLPLAAGDVISRRLVLVTDSAPFAWQPEIEQLKKIDANTFKTILEFMRMISLNGAPWQHARRMGKSQAAATATRYRQ